MNQQPAPPPGTPRPTPQLAVGIAIQNLAATRLGRGFVPLGILGAVGAVEVLVAGLSTAAGWVLVLGAVATATEMLAYGQRVVQRTFGRPRKAWMKAAAVASVVPPVYAVYVLGWRGLRALATGPTLPEIVLAILLGWLGVWVLRCWTRVVELERLARVMTSNLDEYGGTA